ncbi:serine-rich adhesin for platelets [Biomphalaria glabrata]|nr:serine-rich adhesin for platelets [Biomphalaria glabrata]
MPKLLIFFLNLNYFRLKEDGEVTVGRGPAANYFVDSAITLRLISRIHASIIGQTHANGIPKFTIINTGLNGTYINDVKMGYHSENKKVLHEGDKVTFGHPGCASIQPGTLAPQQDSEFQFIFEYVPAQKPLALEENNLQKKTVISCHNLLSQKNIHENTVDDIQLGLPDSTDKLAVPNGNLGTRLADSPQSNASTSEKENDVACAGIRDSKMITGESFENRCTVLPSKDLNSWNCQTTLQERHVKEDFQSVSKCLLSGRKVSHSSPLRSSLTVPSNNSDLYKPQIASLSSQGKDSLMNSHERVLKQNSVDSSDLELTDTFSTSFCKNGGSIQVNSTTIVLRDECEDEDDDSSNAYSSSSEDEDIQFLGATAANGTVANNNFELSPIPRDAVLLKDKYGKKSTGSVSDTSLSSLSTEDKSSLSDSTSTPKKRASLESSENDSSSDSSSDSKCSKSDFKDKTGIIESGKSNDAVSKSQTSPVVGQKDHRVISPCFLKNTSNTSIESKDNSVELSKKCPSCTDGESSSSSDKMSDICSDSSISPPELSPQVPLGPCQSSRSSISPASHSESDSDSSYSDTASRVQSTDSSVESSAKHSLTSHSSAKSDIVKSRRKTFLKDVVPHMYTSSDEDEVFAKNRTKEIVKKIYSPHKKKKTKDKMNSKNNHDISRVGETLSANTLDHNSEQNVVAPFSPALTSLSSSSSTSSISSKKTDQTNHEKERVANHYGAPVSSYVSYSSEKESLSTTILTSLPKLDPLLDPDFYPHKLFSARQPPTLIPSTIPTPKKNTGLVKRTEPILLKSLPLEEMSKDKSSFSDRLKNFASKSSSSSPSSLGTGSQHSPTHSLSSKTKSKLSPQRSSVPSKSSSKSQSVKNSKMDILGKVPTLKKTCSNDMHPSNKTSATTLSQTAKLADVDGGLSRVSNSKTDLSLEAQLKKHTNPSLKESSTPEKSNGKLPNQNRSPLVKKSLPSQAKNPQKDLIGSSVKSSTQVREKTTDDSQQKAPTSKSADSNLSKKLTKNSEPLSTVKSGSVQKSSPATKAITDVKVTPKSKEDSLQDKSSKVPLSKTPQGKTALSSPSVASATSATSTTTDSQKQSSSQAKNTVSKHKICTLDDSAFMKDLENSVTIKKLLTRSKAPSKTAGKSQTKNAAAKNTKSSMQNNKEKDEKDIAKNKQNQNLMRKRKLSSDDDSMDVPRPRRSVTTKPSLPDKEWRVLARNGSISSTGSSTKAKRKRVPAKKSKDGQSKRKRRKKIVSDTTSEEESDNESQDEEEEEEEEEEDWDLPDGVQYYDNLCSAAKCLNPVGNKVDWVQCDHCEQWYHVVCVDCPIEVIQKENVQFHCGLC